MKNISNTKYRIKIALLITSFVVSVAILIYLFSDPLNSSKFTSYLFLLVLFAICINLGLDILKNVINLSQKKWVFYLVKWILTFLAPLSLIVLIEHPLQKKIMVDVSKNLKPTLEYIQDYEKAHATPPLSIKNDTNLKSRYYKKDKFYMLATDIYPSSTDKETIYFNSKDNKWYRFYNNQYEYYKDKKVVPPNLKIYLWFTN